MSDESDTGLQSFNKNKRKVLQDDSSSSSVDSKLCNKKRKHYVYSSDCNSDISGKASPKRKHICKFTSDSETSGSDDERNTLKMGVAQEDCDGGTDESDVGFQSSSESMWESDWASDEEDDKQDNEPTSTTTVVNDVDLGHSSESNDESEKCPICLITFRKQEVGSPETCDHSFCAECIVEWSKNVNTCPVDRQPFNLILVRDNLNGKVTRQIPVEAPNQANEHDLIEEDPTYCEICGRCDREDRLLLCDGCDLGYHLECLVPSLNEVPLEEWFCSDCATNSGTMAEAVDIYDGEVNLLWEDAEHLGRPEGPRRRNNPPRLVPRTRQSERVRTTIAIHRTQNLRSGNVDHLSASSGIEDSSQPGPSTTRNTSAVTSRKKKSVRKMTKRKCRKQKFKPRYRITYDIDTKTGEKIEIKTKIRRYRKRRKLKKKRKVKERRMFKPKSVKKRLAAHLGMCPPRKVGQSLPEVKVSNNPNNIGFQRSLAGIPTLHLFGRRDELDYFSASDSEVENGDGEGVLVRHRSNISSTSMIRRAMQRKTAMAHLPQPTTSATDILSSILDSQAKFHSRNSVLSIDKDGTLKVDTKNTKISITNGDSWSNNEDHVNINIYTNNGTRQVPLFPENSSSNTSPSFNRSNQYINSRTSDHPNFVPTSTVGNSNYNNVNSIGENEEQDMPQDYSLQSVCSTQDPDSLSKKNKKSENKEKNPSGQNTPTSDSEFDIYSDIETVSTSRAEEADFRHTFPICAPALTLDGEEENNESDVDLVIDTEKVDSDKYDPAAPLDTDSEESKEEEVTSTTAIKLTGYYVSAAVHSTSDLPEHVLTNLSCQNGSSSHSDDDADNDDCPNHSIYSAESINLAKSTDFSLLASDNNGRQEIDVNINSNITSSSTLLKDNEHITEELHENLGEKSSDFNHGDKDEVITDADDNKPKRDKANKPSPIKKAKVNHGGLYSDSEDENIVKVDIQQTFGLGDIRNMTEDISEEERSYTPCLDENDPACKQGLEGLDTEMISDEDRNDFDESHELKTASDGDALEINAKESELDFSRPEDYEEGEIVDKLKGNDIEEPKKTNDKSADEDGKTDNKKETATGAKAANTENDTNVKEASFKRLSKNNKERNYRDKDRERSKSKEKRSRADKENKRERRKTKRKEIERYDVRTLIAEKPRRLKDQFGRDETRRRSLSYSSGSQSAPRRTTSRTRRSYSRERERRRRNSSREYRSYSRSGSRNRRRSRSRNKKQLRSPCPDRQKAKRKSRDSSKNKSKRNKSRSRNRSRSASLRRRDWEHRHSRGWTPSLSRSRSPVISRHISPSWTPPRRMESQPVKPQNLTVILTNDSSKKKRDKKKKEKKSKENVTDRQKKRRRSDRTPPPSKEVFASGDNILVSVSFNKDNDERDVSTKRKRDAADELTTKRTRKEKEKRARTVRNKRNQDLSRIKPVAIIDLDKSPFRELTPSPKDVIVLSDSDNGDNNDLLELQKAICDSSEQVALSERNLNNSYINSSGPKTPPEPQIKFSLNAKQTSLRAISNPLHDPNDMEPDIDPQQELENRLNEVLHKGPNTPPEPPNSPPSSPDVYDPFDPTKSRSPTPEPMQASVQSNSVQIINDIREEDRMQASPSGEPKEKHTTPINQLLDSHTPPISSADVQPADSQSSIRETTPDTNLTNSPERPIGVIINQVIQSQASVFPTVVTKPVAATAAYSVAPSLISSTPISRINILSNTVLTSSSMTSVPQRIILPNTSKSSPAKVSPIKSTPIKPMPSKNITKVPLASMKPPTRKSKTRNQNGSDVNEIVNLDFESPYSPGSSDYEDLFEPPPDTGKTSNTSKPAQMNKITKSPAKPPNAFDALFGTSPAFNKNKNKSNSKTSKFGKKGSATITPNKGTKQVGVKLDEDSLKILDELPNSAVEMQVKDKFLKKLNRQERVVEEVKMVLKPHYNKKHVTKEEYKDILRRSVPKICHNKSGEINPKKIQRLIEAYVKKVRHNKKVTSSSSVNPQKT